jgi:hypothetical protein
MRSARDVGPGSARRRGGLCLWLALAAVGCGSEQMSLTFTDDGGVPDPGPGGPDAEPQKGPFDITIASSPPIDVTGAVLWLDPNFGIAHAEAEARTWTDRAGFGLVLERPPVDQNGPTLARLGGQGALRFAGGARLVLSNAIDETGRAALTVGGDGFLIALVVQSDADRSATVFTLTPDAPAAGAARLQLTPVRFTLDQAGHQTVIEAPQALLPGTPHLVIVSSLNGILTLRIDGATVAQTDLPAAPLPFESPAVGGAGAPAMGLDGLLGDVVLVVGPGVSSATDPLELYLRHKYGF